jgi:hypothetical protein
MHNYANIFFHALALNLDLFEKSKINPNGIHSGEHDHDQEKPELVGVL